MRYPSFARFWLSEMADFVNLVPVNHTPQGCSPKHGLTQVNRHTRRSKSLVLCSNRAVTHVKTACTVIEKDRNYEYRRVVGRTKVARLVRIP